jgi:hypothetical protein
MKKNLYLTVILFATGLIPVLLHAAADPVKIPVDARETTGKTITLDFTNGFIIDFQNNTVSDTTVIKIGTGDGVTFREIKKGITAADKKSVQIVFLVKGGAIMLKDQDFELESPIQLIYGAKTYTISHVEAPPGPDPKGGPVVPRKKTPPWTGVEIHDAILAKRYHDDANKKDSLIFLLAALKKVDPSLDAVRTAYKGNAFILALLPTFSATELETFGKKARIHSSKGVKGVNALISKVGDMDVTNLADGIARFLVKRTKEELNIAFFQHFKELINEPKYKDAQILFPKTLEVLNAIDKDIYLFENYITALREAFEKDLSLLLDTTPKVIEEGTFKQYFTDHPDLKYSLLLTLFSSRELVNGTHPGKVIETFPQEYIDGLVDKNAVGALETLQLLSASLRARGGDRYWTTPDTLARLVDKNDTQFITAKFYLGFLYEKGASINFQSHDLQFYLDQVAAREADVKQYAVFVKALGKKCNDLQSAISQINDARPETASIEVYHRAFSAFSDVVGHVNTIGELPHISVNGKITQAVTEYLKIFRQTNDLALNIVQKNYSSAIVNVYNIYLVATGLKGAPTQEVASANTFLYTATPAGGVAVAADSKHNKSSVDIAKKTTDFIKRYGSLMANVVKAKDSEEVAEAVEALALPVGSSSIKKHSTLSITLNAYVGLYLGTEKIKGVDDHYSTNAYGVSAPIGFAVNKGWLTESKWAFSTSAFFSIVDLGAPVAFRFEDDKTEAIPSVKLKDIISPGAFICFGLPRLPLSLNFGYQIGPRLRDVDPAITTVGSKYSRYSVALSVDIPILNLYKSSR